MTQPQNTIWIILIIAYTTGMTVGLGGVARCSDTFDRASPCRISALLRIMSRREIVA